MITFHTHPKIYTQKYIRKVLHSVKEKKKLCLQNETQTISVAQWLRLLLLMLRVCKYKWWYVILYDVCKSFFFEFFLKLLIGSVSEIKDELKFNNYFIIWFILNYNIIVIWSIFFLFAFLIHVKLHPLSTRATCSWLEVVNRTGRPN